MKKTLIAAASTAFLLAGCSTTETEKAAPNENEKKVLHTMESYDLLSVDPADAITSNIFNQIYEGLYRFDANNELVPAAAKSHSVSEDGKVYTFKLDQNAKWSDGKPVTAEHFRYAYERVIETNSPFSYLLEPVKQTKVIDDETLQIELKRPTPYFLSMTTFGTYMPVREDIVKAQGDKFGTDPETNVYNGPFTFKKYQAEQGYTLAKNADYADRKNVKIDEVDVKIIKDPMLAINLFETGELDVAPLNSENVVTYKNKKEYNTFSDSRMFFIRMNQKTDTLKDQKTRQAIDAAYDKKALTETLLGNGSLPADYIVPQELDPKYDKTRQIEASFDATQATQVLADQKLELTMIIEDDDVSKKIGEYIQGSLKQQNVDVKLLSLPKKERLAREGRGDYDLSLASWAPDYQDATTYLNLFMTGNPFNMMDYSNKKYDSLLKQAENELDQDKRLELLSKAETMLLDDQAISPVYQRKNAFLQNTEVKNLARHNVGTDISYKYVEINRK
ncbi:peptide ABC transporter substrate-binding protein [Exiguobacterium antarcticum]|uniref:peptide ABC transporter substrate-binding protein n=1 Tax=Exiguobacterium antarcticum TaxID=132920 RepID=UPI000285E822|nr:peptide ABC transporter substrate-binding protein [Exiguobacterium antarcticum]AFS71385.1 Extracellular solute-binding protein family 5 [Exiguobacterium antarcticum B7]